MKKQTREKLIWFVCKKSKRSFTSVKVECFFQKQIYFYFKSGTSLVFGTCFDDSVLLWKQFSIFKLLKRQQLIYLSFFFYSFFQLNKHLSYKGKHNRFL